MDTKLRIMCLDWDYEQSDVVFNLAMDCTVCNIEHNVLESSEKKNNNNNNNNKIIIKTHL